LKLRYFKMDDVPIFDMYNATIPARYASGEYSTIKFYFKKTIVRYFSNTSGIHEGYDGGQPIHAGYMIFYITFGMC